MNPLIANLLLTNPNFTDESLDEQVAALQQKEAGKAASSAADIEANRQKGLNAFPFDPAINAYPDNPNYNPKVADDLRNLGMLTPVVPAAQLQTAASQVESAPTMKPAAKPKGPKVEKLAFEGDNIEGDVPGPRLRLEDLLGPRELPTLPEEKAVEAEIDDLAEAQKQRKDMAFSQAMLKAGAAINAAISGQGHTKADLAPIEAFDPLVGMEVAEVKEKRADKKGKADLKALEQETDIRGKKAPLELETAELSLEKLREQRGDDAAKSDPDSEISQLARQMVVGDLRKIGMKDLANRIENSRSSAKQVEDLVGQNNLSNRMTQYENQQTRLEAARIAAEAKKESAKEKSDEKKYSNIQGLRKELMGGTLGKQYGNYLNANRAERAITEFEKNPTGYSDYASIMGSLKALQGDESVVREAEVRMGMQATSLPNKIKNWTSSMATGKMLQPAQRKQMIDAVKILSQVAKGQFKESIAPVMKQAELQGIDPELLLGKLDGESITAPQKSSPQDEEAIKWAKENPDDPRAARILKANGM